LDELFTHQIFIHTPIEDCRDDISDISIAFSEKRSEDSGTETESLKDFINDVDESCIESSVPEFSDSEEEKFESGIYD